MGSDEDKGIKGGRKKDGRERMKKGMEIRRKEIETKKGMKINICG